MRRVLSADTRAWAESVPLGRALTCRISRPAKRFSRSAAAPAAANPFAMLQEPASAAAPSLASADERLLLLHRRGLNESFLGALAARMHADPTADLGPTIGQYQQHLRDLSRTYAKQPTAPPTNGTAPSVSLQAPSQAADPPPPAPFALAASAPFSFGPSAGPFFATAGAAPLPGAFGSAGGLAAALPFPSAVAPQSQHPIGGAGASRPTAPPPFQFSFSTPMPSFSPGAGPAEGGADDEDSGIPEGEEESFSGDRANAELIRTGAGEEDEKTLVDVRCKLFVLERERGWTDLGVAIFKVNQKDDDSRRSRMLARAEGSGKILLNAWINANVVVECAGEGRREVSLLCVNQDAKLAKYLVRCKEPSMCQQLCDRIASLTPPPPPTEQLQNS